MNEEMKNSCINESHVLYFYLFYCYAYFMNILNITKLTR